MESNSHEVEILEAAVAGIPRVAEVVASVSLEHRARALEAAESSYRQTVRNLGYEEGPSQSWVSAVMLRLQTEVKDKVSAKQNMLKKLHEELVRADTGPDSNVHDIRETAER